MTHPSLSMTHQVHHLVRDDLGHIAVVARGGGLAGQQRRLAVGDEAWSVGGEEQCTQLSAAGLAARSQVLSALQCRASKLIPRSLFAQPLATAQQLFGKCTATEGAPTPVRHGPH